LFHHSPHTEIYTLSLHDALPISCGRTGHEAQPTVSRRLWRQSESTRFYAATTHELPGFACLFENHLSRGVGCAGGQCVAAHPTRSEEHTSELQSRGHLVCRLLLE